VRVLIASFAERTHFIGMVPLAWALRAAGHEVRVASQPALIDVVATTGLTGVPVGRDHMLTAVVNSARRFGADGPEFDLTTDPRELTWEELRSAYEQIVLPLWWKVINEPMIADLTDLCLSWRPDLVLWEPLTFAGGIAAKACGAAHARVPFALDLSARLRGGCLLRLAEQPGRRSEDPLGRWLGRRAGAYGCDFSEDLVLGQFTVDCMPPSVRPEVDPPLDRVNMRFVDYNGRSVVPGWLRVPPERPRVCLTLGTTATERMGGYAVSVDRLLDGLADLDVEIVATIPAGERDRLGPVPDNVRLVGFTPLHVLAPTCEVLINHGGAGTICTGLLHGVPQLLVMDHYFDESLWGRSLTELGAGLALKAGEATPDGIRERLTRMLGTPDFRHGAARIREEMLGMPTPSMVVPELEGRVPAHRS
jgi:glycosyltransferase (activator-dependent family)